MTPVRRTRREDDEEDVSDACAARVNIGDGARVDAIMVTRERVAIIAPPTDAARDECWQGNPKK
ncbi:MAG TPA: hypothetical protein DCE20_10230, partial [Gammaproteobacteria bacterium]|nr:hypothetical protein [Gammaproteobacteria bacterium]